MPSAETATVARPDLVGPRSPWLFSASLDLAAFLGSAVVSLVLLAIGARFGLLEDDTPEWTWITAVLLVDVAHVYATAFRVYFVPAEFRRRVWLYTLTPLLAYLIGVALYSEGEQLFWRTLAYLAVFHFVRQQYGWVALYRSRNGETGRVGYWIDTAAIYLATIYPLIYWHTHLPRRFWWFLDHDFAALPGAIERLAAPVYWGALGLYAARSLTRAVLRREFNPGKDIVVATTAACWYLGIVALNSDYAFTVTNVIIHGVPYFVLIDWYRTHQPDRAAPVSSIDRGVGQAPASRRIARITVFLATVWLLAFIEEMLWDRGVWHERSHLFGPAWEWGSLRTWLVPLLAVPQISHYVLDGFLWRRRSS